MDKVKDNMFRIVILIALFISLSIAVFALGYSEVTMETVFQTGEIKIDLNGGKCIFDDKTMQLEPNRVIIEEFTVKNIGTANCRYKVYLTNIDGAMSDTLTFDIYDETKALIKSIKLKDFTIENAIDLKTILKPGEMNTFTINAYIPASAGNEYQDNSVSFDMIAEAIQSDNN